MVEAEKQSKVIEDDAHPESSDIDNVELDALNSDDELQDSEVVEHEKKEESRGGVPLSEHVKLRKKKQEAEAELERLKRERDAFRNERDLALLASDGAPRKEQ